MSRGDKKVGQVRELKAVPDLKMTEYIGKAKQNMTSPARNTDPITRNSIPIKAIRNLKNATNTRPNALIRFSKAFRVLSAAEELTNC